MLTRVKSIWVAGLGISVLVVLIISIVMVVDTSKSNAVDSQRIANQFCSDMGRKLSGGFHLAFGLAESMAEMDSVGFLLGTMSLPASIRKENAAGTPVDPRRDSSVISLMNRFRQQINIFGIPVQFQSWSLNSITITLTNGLMYGVFNEFNRTYPGKWEGYLVANPAPGTTGVVPVLVSSKVLNTDDPEIQNNIEQNLSTQIFDGTEQLSYRILQTETEKEKEEGWTPLYLMRTGIGAPVRTSLSYSFIVKDTNHALVGVTSVSTSLDFVGELLRSIPLPDIRFAFVVQQEGSGAWGSALIPDDPAHPQNYSAQDLVIATSDSNISSYSKCVGGTWRLIDDLGNPIGGCNGTQSFYTPTEFELYSSSPRSHLVSRVQRKIMQKGKSRWNEIEEIMSFYASNDRVLISPFSRKGLSWCLVLVVYDSFVPVTEQSQDAVYAITVGLVLQLVIIGIAMMMAREQPHARSALLEDITAD